MDVLQTRPWLARVASSSCALVRAVVYENHEFAAIKTHNSPSFLTGRLYLLIRTLGQEQSSQRPAQRTQLDCVRLGDQMVYSTRVYGQERAWLARRDASSARVASVWGCTTSILYTMGWAVCICDRGSCAKSNSHTVVRGPQRLLRFHVSRTLARCYGRVCPAKT
jgi:hypothetical protein